MSRLPTRSFFHDVTARFHEYLKFLPWFVAQLFLNTFYDT